MLNKIQKKSDTNFTGLYRGVFHENDPRYVTPTQKPFPLPRLFQY